MRKLNLLIITLILSELFLMLVLFTGKSETAVESNGWRKKVTEKTDRLHGVPILLYHNIVEDDSKSKSSYAVTRSALIRHFEILKKLDIDVLPLKKFVGNLAYHGDYHKKSVIITFDDDYSSMHRILLPIVKQYGYHVTLFVYTSGIAKSGSTSALNWNKLRGMDNSYIDIQCHSVNHLDLTKFEDGDRESGRVLMEELVLSKMTIEKYLGKKVSFFAFPYGRYSLSLLELAGRAGYDRVFSTDYGSNIVTRDNYCLRRHHIKRSYSDDFFTSLVK